MAATATTTSTEKGRRIVGAERQTLAKDLVKRYTNGESIRALAASTGRSYGFVHRVLTESGRLLGRIVGRYPTRMRRAGGHGHVVPARCSQRADPANVDGAARLRQNVNRRSARCGGPRGGAGIFRGPRPVGGTG